MLLHFTSIKPILVGFILHKKIDKVHYYLCLTTDSPSYKCKHCCLLLVTKCCGMGGCRLAMYCTDAIKTPPNIESITALLFLYCISKLVQLSSLALVNMMGINWNAAQMLSYSSFPQKQVRTITTLFIFLLYFIIDTTFLTSTL